MPGREGGRETDVVKAACVVQIEFDGLDRRGVAEKAGWEKGRERDVPMVPQETVGGGPVDAAKLGRSDRRCRLW